MTLDNGVYLNGGNKWNKIEDDKLYDIVGYLHSDGKLYPTKRKNLFYNHLYFVVVKKYKKTGKVELERQSYEEYDEIKNSRLSFMFDKNTRQLEPHTGYDDVTKNKIETIEVSKAKYNEIMKKYDETQHIPIKELTDKEVSELVRLEKISGKKLTDEEVEEMRKRLSGSGFNKKQLTKIILDKNKVIADLEETAYGRGIYDPHSYLDNILDSNTTSQNIIIHREHFNSVPKYIKSLDLEI